MRGHFLIAVLAALLVLANTITHAVFACGMTTHARVVESCHQAEADQAGQGDRRDGEVPVCCQQPEIAAANSTLKVPGDSSDAAGPAAFGSAGASIGVAPAALQASGSRRVSPPRSAAQAAGPYLFFQTLLL